LETERHHIQPLALGGPDVPGNIVNCCPTSHANIHVLLRALCRGKMPPKATRAERRYADRGFLAWVQAGRPGKAP